MVNRCCSACHPVSLTGTRLLLVVVSDNLFNLQSHGES